MGVHRELPLLTIRNSTLFPSVVLQVTIERPDSLAAIEAALASEDKSVAVFSQHDARVDRPEQAHLYPVGTTAVIQQISPSQQGQDGVHAVLLGVERVSLADISEGEDHRRARFSGLESQPGEPAEVEALQRRLTELASRIQSTVPGAPPVDIGALGRQLESPFHLVYLLASMVPLTLEKAQLLLQLDGEIEAMKMLVRYLDHEVQVLELKGQIASRAREVMDREQREYMLRRQLDAIRAELGETDQGDNDLRQRMEALDLPSAVAEEVERSLHRLESLPPSASEFHILSTYIELVLELPWEVATTNVLDVDRAAKVLDEDHFGLAKVKLRILEYLAVLVLNPDAAAPILCFVGPPGVGKTSLGASIARAMGRKFDRFSLGGVHDESELRGHRRTYVGAMPGRIIQSLRRLGVRNPLIMLDEIDKIGRDQRGDPTAALLEILDPAQNTTFRDNYLDLPFDLSKVFFITTANSLDRLSKPLLDRMEILRIEGYSDEEKVEIAQQYLLPRQLQRAGLAAADLEIPKATLRTLISGFTREAGVRQLEQRLGQLARRAALKKARGEQLQRALGVEHLPTWLGSSAAVRSRVRSGSRPGVATGLAWTEAGGEILSVEAIRSLHGDSLQLTGQLGDVMKESAVAARSYVAAHGLGERAASSIRAASSDGVHIHVPAGAIPKDGPSAGVTMAMALASLFQEIPVRADTAMTGEITLSGWVLAVGGIREKILAARRAGIKRVILPEENRQDVVDVPPEVLADVELVYVATLDQALTAGLQSEPTGSER